MGGRSTADAVLAGFLPLSEDFEPPPVRWREGNIAVVGQGGEVDVDPEPEVAGCHRLRLLGVKALSSTRLAPPASITKCINQAFEASLRAVPAALQVDEHVVVDVVVGGSTADLAHGRDNDLRALREVDYRRGEAEGVPRVVVVAHPGHVWVPQGDDHEARLGRRDRLEGAFLVEEGRAPGESLLDGGQRSAP
eukprot:jgi/Chrpa1/17535/Chrysochromulina_OHIO_Genome00023103-RA